MSGGFFEYSQYKIGYIADEIEKIISRNGLEKTKEEMKDESWYGSDWYEKYPEEKFHPKHSDEVLNKLKEAVKTLRIAEVYAQRIDWYLSGDDGDENFLKRLKNDLDSLDKD